MTLSLFYILCLAPLATLAFVNPAQPSLRFPPVCVKDFCSDRPDGNYRHCHPQQCVEGVYVSCSNGIAYVMTCPGWLYFHEDTNQCNYTPDCPEFWFPDTKQSVPPVQPQPAPAAQQQ
ncbi:unnamed protein product [Lymnaea stagnalis]|uniref:Chitin-binding type-2 domain-containing protein n=1 Tax=Lymnaea stagnalis TaxID=6523 RepID=A0AAV2IA34_LYMST